MVIIDEDEDSFVIDDKTSGDGAEPRISPRLHNSNIFNIDINSRNNLVEKSHEESKLQLHAKI